MRKSPSLHGRKSNPNPKFLGTAEAYFVCHISPNFQISLNYAFIGCPQSVGRMFMIIINRYKNCFSVLPFNFHRLVLPRFIKRADERAPAVQISRLQFFISSHSNRNRAGGLYGDSGDLSCFHLAENQIIMDFAK